MLKQMNERKENAAGVMPGDAYRAKNTDAGRILTVTGPIDPKEMGVTLPHEHVMVDFIGAEKTGKHRYDPDDVIETMEPYLAQLTALGVRTFVDCTPAYLARDVGVLLELSGRTGLHIVTNTGEYKEPHLPQSTIEATAPDLAEGWITEYREGIDGTEVRPGFIKTAVNQGVLQAVQRKVIEAAAITSQETGLTIGTHTASGIAALEILGILDRHSVDPGKWIFIHAQVEADYDLIRIVAKRGAWIEIDGIGEGKEEQNLAPLLKLLDDGFEDQILISQDAGWYMVGEEPGAQKRPFSFLHERFLPLIKRYGVDDELIRKLTVENPARAFVIS